MHKVLFINGAPYSGKDTAGELLAPVLRSQGQMVRIEKFARPIDAALQGLFAGTQYAEKYVTRAQATNGDKDTKDFFAHRDVSVRDLKIGFSEDFVKPLMGSGTFGMLCAMRTAQALTGLHNSVTLITDCGFSEEMRTMISALGCDGFQYALLRVSADGHTYEGDSRSDVVLSDVMGRTFEVHNTKENKAAYEDDLLAAVGEWLIESE